MTILNRENDGLYSILLTLVAAIIREKKINRDDLIRVWGGIPTTSKENNQEDGEKRRSRFRGTLNRWVALGLFIDDGACISLAIDREKGESEEAFLARIPTICRRLALSLEHAKPMWPEGDKVTEEGLGLTADLCRGLAWCLSQDIYSLPTSWTDGIDNLLAYQVIHGRSIIQNDTRWSGLQDWARFLGFAVDSGGGIFFDPTVAVRSELGEFIRYNEQIPGDEFVSHLSARVPVFDAGLYRIEVEKALRPEAWSAPPVGSLSTSLSFALRRLQKQGIIRLVTLADANSRLTLTRQGGRAWETFTHVKLLREL